MNREKEMKERESEKGKQFPISKGVSHFFKLDEIKLISEKFLFLPKKMI